jgi:cysteine desulfurase
MKFPIYLDYNATTPVDKRVVETMLPFFTDVYGNAASNNHLYGWQAAEAVQIAREQVAQLINANDKEIIFTSGATEAINLAIKGVYYSYQKKGNHIITCTTEHNAGLDTCKFLEKKGARVSYIPVHENGEINLQLLEDAIEPATILIAVMYANNETGVIHPIKKIATIAKEKGIIFFSDATQAIGKIHVDVVRDDIDMLSMSAHKIYGPKGVGALYIKSKSPRIQLEPLIHGGGHENNVRSGTLNVPGIVGFGKACEISTQEMHVNAAIKKLWSQLEDNLLATGECFINGTGAARLPNTINIVFKNVDKNAMLTALTKKIAISTGSACTSAKPQPSHVLKAMGLDDSLASLAVRISLGRFTSEEDINFTSSYIKKIIETLRQEKFKV